MMRYIQWRTLQDIVKTSKWIVMSTEHIFYLEDRWSACFKSWNFPLWPLYLVINELPHKKRFSKDNMILAGLWFGSSKPAMWVYLKPFHSALSRLERDGKVIESPYRPRILNICAILLCETCDLAANACICHNVHFNGSFCCFKCLQPDCTVKAGQKGELVHTLHFNRENLKGVQRTHAEFLADAKEAISEGKAVRGVKSPCWFAGLHYYDIVKGTAVNYMHCVLEGITKFLLHKWFSPSFKTKPFNVTDEVNKDNEML